MACLLLIIVYQTWAKKSNKKYSLKDNDKEKYKGRDLSNDESLYTYDFLSSLTPMKVTVLDDIKSFVDKKGKVNRNDVVKLGLNNAIQNGYERGEKIFVKNIYTDKNVLIGVSSIRHGLNGTNNRLVTNARLGIKIGELVKNAVPINALNDEAKNVTGTYAMAAYANDDAGNEFVAIITVEQQDNSIVDCQFYNVAHAISGRIKKSSEVGTKPQGSIPINATSMISISDFLKIVNETYQSVLS